MAGISAGWTLLLETPRYLPPRPTASGFREAVFRLDLDANLCGPPALFSPSWLMVLDDDHQVLVLWGLLCHSYHQLLDDCQRHCPLFFSL